MASWEGVLRASHKGVCVDKSNEIEIKIVDTLVNLLKILIRLDPESLLAAVRFILCYSKCLFS